MIYAILGSLAFLGAALLLKRPMLLFPIMLLVPSVFDYAVPLGPIKVHPNNILLLALATGIGALRLRQKKIRLDPCHLILVATILWILFNCMLQAGPRTFRRILALALMYLSFETTYQAISDQEDLSRLRTWIALSGGLASITGWILRNPSYFNGRAYGSFGNPNALGMYLAGCLPLTLSLVMGETRPYLKRFMSFVFVLTLYGLWISGSRGALVGAIGGCIFVISRHIKQAILAGAVLGSCFLFVNTIEESSHGFERMPNAAEIAPVVFENSKIWLAYNGFEEASFDQPIWVSPKEIDAFPRSLGARMMIWYQAVRAGFKNVLLGLGPGNSLFAAVPFDSKVFNNCFNIYLSSFVEAGIPGLVLHLLWLQLLLSSIFQGLVREDPLKLFAGTGGATLAFFFHGLVEDTYFGIYSNWLIGMVFAMTILCERLSRPPPKPLHSE